MNYLLFLVTLISITALNCVNRSNRSLEIVVDNRVFRITPKVSVLRIDTSINQKSISINRKIDLNFYEREKIFDLVRRGLTRKSLVIVTPTCFAGQNFRITYIENLDTLGFRETSVGSWTSICPEFNEISKILNREIVDEGLDE